VKKRGGLPAVPKAPRTRDEQWTLCLDALNGPLRSDKGWGHCIGWAHQFFSDCASTIWRITGKMPEVPSLVAGGSHIRNDAAWFVSGRAAEWLKVRNAEMEGVLAKQQKDGSFRYDGKYRRGHFENTSSGQCAIPAFQLLEHARLTGDGRALAGGLRALEYMKRFRTPRGAQVWECPLHAPDILASAYLVLAYARGYELTGKKEYLRLATRWAVSGMPFIYQWSNRPIMMYATTPTLCATGWRAPVWIGLPVQWCGTVYAHALLRLAPHDKTLDWRKVAEGILVAGEQMQYTKGPSKGCLPDVFHLAAQIRAPADINPCALVSLRLQIEGKLDSLAVAANKKHRVVAPFPVAIRGGVAVVRARKGSRYQVVINGKRIVTVESKGVDRIPLTARNVVAAPSKKPAATTVLSTVRLDTIPKVGSVVVKSRFFGYQSGADRVLLSVPAGTRIRGTLRVYAEDGVTVLSEVRDVEVKAGQIHTITK